VREEVPYSFNVVDGLVCELTDKAARAYITAARERDPSVKPWLIEAGMNHEHPGLEDESARASMRTISKVAVELAIALRLVFPAREFVVDSDPTNYVLTYYQRGDGAPEEDEDPTEPLPEAIFCATCNAKTQYILRDTPDSEFPKAEWADCAACGAEMFVRAGVERTVVGPAGESTASVSIKS
jgi:hypothetical protein